MANARIHYPTQNNPACMADVSIRFLLLVKLSPFLRPNTSLLLTYQ